MRISKIMAVILANSGERTDILDYNLTDVERVVNNSQNIQEIGKDDKDNQ